MYEECKQRQMCFHISFSITETAPIKRNELCEAPIRVEREHSAANLNNKLQQASQAKPSLTCTLPICAETGNESNIVRGR